METLEDLKSQLRREVSFEESKKEMAALGRERRDLKRQIKAKQFARKNPKITGFVGGLKKFTSSAASGVQKAAAETQRRERAKAQSRSKKKGKARKKAAGTYNMYGERIW